MADMASKKPENTRKVFDVAKPGKTVPPSTARPTIVGHKSQFQDPMMAASKSQDSVDPSVVPEENKLVSTTAPTIKPINVQAHNDQLKTKESKAAVSALPPKLSENEAKDTTTEISVSGDTPELDQQPEETTTPTDDKSTESEAESNTSEPTQVETKPEEGEANEVLEPKPAEPAQDNNLSNEATAEAEAVVAKSEAEKQAEKAEHEEAARKEATEKLIADKTYFVQVGEHRKKQSGGKVFFIVLFVIIGLVALGYLALDSGMIKADIDLPVHLFRIES